MLKKIKIKDILSLFSGIILIKGKDILKNNYIVHDYLYSLDVGKGVELIHMKNWKIYSIVITVLLILVIIGVFIYFAIFQKTVTEAEAKNIAMEYAKVIEDNVTVLSIKKDHGDREYEIKFYDDLYEYEVEINYRTGKVVNFEKDIRDNVNIQDNQTASMTEDEAKAIALQRVGKSNDEVTFTRVRVDRENGITVYEVDFYDTEKEYEISIDMNTKEIINYQEDYFHPHHDNSTSPTTNDYIGVEKAKEIVLNHAGLNSNDVTFHKVELDVDYPIATYEIEFYYQYFEYEYELNATTGEILKYERDR